MATKDDKTEEVVIPLDRASLQRLARLSRDCGQHPCDLAAALLHDLLLDDERAHRAPGYYH